MAPSRSERVVQYVYKCIGCDHLRIMLPCSASVRALTCRICTPEHIQDDEGMTFPSELEREVYKWLELYPMECEPRPQHWASEVAAFPGLGKTLASCKVDLVFFNGLSATRESMLRGLLVFLDGDGHFPSRYTTQGCDAAAAHQRHVDQRISVEAAEAGFHILTVAEKDKFHVLKMISMAWIKVVKAEGGWVMVSRSWNSGTHRCTTEKVRRAGYETEHHGAQDSVHTGNVLDLLSLS
jgi:hypothetical protein